MEMTVFIELASAAFIVIGATFLFVGSFGLAKLPDTMRRLHAPTKATTLGIGALLIASMLYFLLLHQTFGVHEALVTLFLFLTAPVTANMVAKAHIFRSIRLQRDLPPAANGSGWATLVSPPNSSDERSHGGPSRKPGSANPQKIPPS
jgi:multicomponent K+:H+ antiporter subunit G